MSFVPDTQNKEFQDALNLIQYTRQSVFLTGKAGTGQIDLPEIYLREYEEKACSACPYRNSRHQCRRQYLHSFFKLPFYPLLPMTRTSVCNGDASTNFSNTPNPPQTTGRTGTGHHRRDFHGTRRHHRRRRPHPASIPATCANPSAANRYYWWAMCSSWNPSSRR